MIYENRMKVILELLCCCLFSSFIFAEELPEIKVPEGFVVEMLHKVDKEKKQGSWISVCADPKGDLYACDEKGDLFKIVLKNKKVESVKKVESPGYAHGLLWAFDSLYMMSNGSKTHNGLNRLTDTNGDGEFDKIENIVPLNGKGGHGPHIMRVSPDGKHIVFICGNYTLLPSEITYPVNPDYREDTLLTHLKDANGHAANLKAPGGYIMQINPDGSDRRIIASGFRNTFGFAFDRHGEIFGYDADMEWDAGTPWYRPTRILHIVKNGEYGWRTGTSKWPAYYEDSLNEVINIGPGSPTAVFHGKDSAFPAPYNDRLFAVDWTFGRIYSIQLKAHGSTYKADKEVFLSGKPLPIVGASFGPDGDLYFVTGGRKIQSYLYRVSYQGSNKIEALKATELTSENKLRRKIESWHRPIQNIAKEIWPHLSSEDRFIRFSARRALEFQALEDWRALYHKETDPKTLISAAIVIARTGSQSEKQSVFSKLFKIDFNTLHNNEKLSYLRALSLCFIRLGQPGEKLTGKIMRKLDSNFPSSDQMLNRELCRLLVYLESPSVISKSVFLMSTSVAVKENLDTEMLDVNDKYGVSLKNMLKNQPDAQALHYALMLREMKRHWDSKNAKAYFEWLHQAEQKNGGRSYKGFVKMIRKDALRYQSDEIKVYVKQLSENVAPVEMVVAQGPGRLWTLDEAVKTLKGTQHADLNNGKKMFKAAMCATCHTFAGEGGSAGPDLTQLGNRFSPRDIIDATINPSSAIAEQYQLYEVLLKSDEMLTGKIMADEKDFLEVATNFLDTSITRKVMKSEVVSVKPSSVSAMPPGLINALNPQELNDLMAFLTSAE